MGEKFKRNKAAAFRHQQDVRYDNFRAADLFSEVDCNGDGEAYWRARPLGDIEGSDAPAPQGITRWLPR